MPRNEAADRYSPEMAAAFSAGGTWRAATMKSSGVLATRMPRAPTMIVSRVTNAIAPIDASVIGLVFRGHQLGEPGLQLPRLPVVEPADAEQHRVEGEAEHDQGDRQAGHGGPADRGHQGGDHRKRGGHYQRDDEAQQRQAKL